MGERGRHMWVCKAGTVVALVLLFMTVVAGLGG